MRKQQIKRRLTYKDEKAIQTSRSYSSFKKADRIKNFEIVGSLKSLSNRTKGNNGESNLLLEFDEEI